MNRKKISKIFLCFLIFHFLGQQGFSKYQEPDFHDAPYHKITLVMANSFLTNSIPENSNTLLIVPTLGFNYNYWFHRKWGIGLHNDVLLQQFKVERHDDKRELVRENPVAMCTIISFKPHYRWTLMGGYGIELEHNENINLFRFGIEYGIPIRDNWELEFNLEYDHKIKAYSSFMAGVAFSKIFFRKTSRHE